MGWGTAEECQPEAPCSVVPQHGEQNNTHDRKSNKTDLLDWVNTVLVLDQPQPDYSNTFGNGGSNGTLTTQDGGKTWKGSRITIDKWDSGPSCPYFDNQNVTTRAGSVFEVECGMRRPGGDIKMIQPGNFMSCIEACEKTRKCVQVVMHDGKCFLKSKTGTSVASSEAKGARLVQKASGP